MKKLGLRGRYSPMNEATDAQRVAVQERIAVAEAEGVGILEVRYSTYIGPGCAAERGAICVVVDGRIGWLVEKDGRLT